MLCCWILFPAEAAEPQRIKPQKLFVLFCVFRGSKHPLKLSVPPLLQKTTLRVLRISPKAQAIATNPRIAAGHSTKCEGWTLDVRQPIDNQAVDVERTIRHGCYVVGFCFPQRQQSRRELNHKNFSCCFVCLVVPNIP